MTGSIAGPAHMGTIFGFRPKMMIVTGSPMDVVLAVSGAFARDFTNDYLYMNCSAGYGAGSTWIRLGSTE